ncbi:MAG: 30S ribosome-binding factor RbfA [Candidatus Omnitrophota bacterium]
MGARPERVQEALRREVSMIVQKEIKDPRLGFITITKVEVTKDLKNAFVYYSVLGEEKVANNTRHALKSAVGYIRKLIGERMKMKYVPEITFRQDMSIEHAKRVYEILDNIKKEKSEDES